MFIVEYFKEKLPNISTAEAEKIQHFFKQKHASKNTFVLHENEENVPLYIVAKGVLRIFSINLQGRECTCDFLMEKHCGTLLAHFIHPSAAQGYIEALEDTQYFYIFKKDLTQLMQSIPTLYLWYSDLLEKTMVQWAFRSNGYQNSFLSAQERDALFLKDQPLCDILQKRLSDKMLASFLQMTPETFSRLKQKH